MHGSGEEVKGEEKRSVPDFHKVVDVCVGLVVTFCLLRDALWRTQEAASQMKDKTQTQRTHEAQKTHGTHGMHGTHWTHNVHWAYRVQGVRYVLLGEGKKRGYTGE